MNKYKIKDYMLGLEDFPIVQERSILKEALDKMSYHGLGIAVIVNKKGILKGVITDGDLRRKLISIQKPLIAIMVDDAINLAIKRPITIKIDVLLKNAINMMYKKQILDLVVVDKNKKVLGLLHLKKLISLIKLK